MDPAELEQRCLQHRDLNWLLHRAAHQLGEAMEAEAGTRGLTMRGQIVLTALVQREHFDDKPWTQLALGQALGVDKTTMTALLDKLEQRDLVVRKADPNDRRSRIPHVTEAGRKLQAELARELSRVEDRVLAALGDTERDALRGLLRRIINVHGAPPVNPPGSCL